MVKFGYTILYVEDVTKSIEFYETAFGFNRKFVTPENDYGELLTGQTTISFASHGLAQSNLKKGFVAAKQTDIAFGIELGFIAEDVQATIDKAIACGAVLEEPPIVKPWGQTVGYVRDIDGFLLEICTEVK